jgi:hypothetical protein
VIDDEARFWELAARLLSRPGVTRSTMMGYPCLRLNGAFFASWDPHHQQVVAKLDASAVAELIDAGRGEPFAPNGRRFREWVALPVTQRRTWARTLERAFDAAAARAIDPNS